MKYKTFKFVDKEGNNCSWINPIRQHKKLLIKKLGVSGKQYKKLLHCARLLKVK
jgi:hypothetical protein